jgi:hypothetical protein
MQIARTAAERLRLIRFARIPLSMLVVGFLAYFTPRYLRERNEARSYERAARCSDVAGKFVRIESTDCKLILRAEVTHLYSKSMGRGSVRMVRVRLPDGTARTCQLHDDEFWLSLEPGHLVEVELWRDRVMRMRTNTGDQATSGNPSWDSDNILNGTIAIVALLSFLIAIFFIAGRRARAQLVSR